MVTSKYPDVPNIVMYSPLMVARFTITGNTSTYTPTCHFGNDTCHNHSTTIPRDGRVEIQFILDRSEVINGTVISLRISDSALHEISRQNYTVVIPSQRKCLLFGHNKQYCSPLQ